MRKLFSVLLALVGGLLRGADPITVNTLIQFDTTPQQVTDAVMVTVSVGAETWQTVVSADPDDRQIGATEPGNTPTLTITTDAAHTLQTPFKVGSTTYSTSSARGFRAVMSANAGIKATYSGDGQRLGLGFWMRFNGDYVDNSPRDLVVMSNISGYQVLQIYDDNGRPFFHTHYSPGADPGTGNNVTFDRSVWHWFAMAQVPGGSTFRIQAWYFNSVSGKYISVGESTAEITGVSTLGVQTLTIGCVKYFSNATQSVDFANIVIDYNGTYPIGPLPDGPPVGAWTIPTLNATRLNFSP